MPISTLNNIYLALALFMLGALLFWIAWFITLLLMRDRRINGTRLNSKENDSAHMQAQADKIKRQQSERHEHRARYEHRVLMQARANKIKRRE